MRDKYLEIRPMTKHGIKNYTGLLNRCLGDWLNKPMNSITRDMMEIRHRELTKPTRFGTGPKFRKIGAKVFYIESEVIAWLDSNTFGSTSQYQR